MLICYPILRACTLWLYFIRAACVFCKFDSPEWKPHTVGNIYIAWTIVYFSVQGLDFDRGRGMGMLLRRWGLGRTTEMETRALPNISAVSPFSLFLCFPYESDLSLYLFYFSFFCIYIWNSILYPIPTFAHCQPNSAVRTSLCSYTHMQIRE